MSATDSRRPPSCSEPDAELAYFPRPITAASGEQLAYRFMGERLGGCATGTGPVDFGTMMGTMSTSEMGASYGSAYPAGGYGSSMMGGNGSGSGVRAWA